MLNFNTSEIKTNCIKKIPVVIELLFVTCSVYGSKNLWNSSKNPPARLIKYITVPLPYMRTRMTYIPVEVADQFSDFIIKRDEQVLDAVKARARDFSTISILKLLYQLRYSPMTFSDLYVKSNIRMKRSFLNYLHLCMAYSFIRKEPLGANMVYFITDKGRIMLDLFTQKAN